MTGACCCGNERSWARRCEGHCRSRAARKPPSSLPGHPNARPAVWPCGHAPTTRTREGRSLRRPDRYTAHGAPRQMHPPDSAVHAATIGAMPRAHTCTVCQNKMNTQLYKLPATGTRVGTNGRWKWIRLKRFNSMISKEYPGIVLPPVPLRQCPGPCGVQQPVRTQACARRRHSQCIVMPVRMFQNVVDLRKERKHG